MIFTGTNRGQPAFRLVIRRALAGSATDPGRQVGFKPRLRAYCAMVAPTGSIFGTGATQSKERDPYAWQRTDQSH